MIEIIPAKNILFLLLLAKPVIIPVLTEQIREDRTRMEQETKVENPSLPIKNLGDSNC